MGKVESLFHVGITVADMEDSLSFYRDGLGFPVESDAQLSHDYLKNLLGVDFRSLHIVFLAIPGGGSIELLSYKGTRATLQEALPSDPGRGHICFYVDDVEEVSTRLAALGYESRSRGPVDIVAGPRKGARNIYFRDPDGFHVELFQEAAEHAR